MIEINYTKGYPSTDIELFKVNGFYEFLEKNKGAFIDYFYDNTDISKISHVFFKKELYDKHLKGSYVFVVQNRLNMDKYIFWVYEDSTIQITSKDFLQFFNIIKIFVRQYVISDIVN